jgi:2-hydroxy-3-keto-5-methylthiopentenyl-1-phosphate phosphatase
VVNLQAASVFVDLDGTVATQDTGVYLLEQLAPTRWRDIEARHLSGEIGSRQCMVPS